MEGVTEHDKNDENIIDIEIQKQTIGDLTKFSVTQAVLSDLRSKYEGKKFEVATGKGMQSAIQARAEIREWRVGLGHDKDRKVRPILDAHKHLLSEFKRITAELSSLEDPIDSQIQEELKRKATEKAERDALEAARVSSIQARLDVLRNTPVSLSMAQSDKVLTTLEELKGMSFPVEEFEEFVLVAEALRDASVISLQTLYESALAREAEQERLRLEREEIDRTRREAEIEAKAERDRIEAEAKKVKEAQEADAKRIREAQEEERRKLDAEREKMEAERREKEKKSEDERKIREKQLANLQAIREIPFTVDSSTTSSDEISGIMTRNEERILTDPKFGPYLEEAKTALTTVQVRLEAMRKIALDRETQKEVEHKRVAEDARREAEQLAIDEAKRLYQEKLDRQEREQAEKVRLAEEHRRKLTEARLDSPITALLRILELAINVEDHPDDRQVREEISVIAEANLIDSEEFAKVAEKETKVVTLPKRRKGKKG